MFLFWVSLFCEWRYKWDRFLAILAQFTWPWAQPLDGSNVLMFLLERGQNPSLLNF